jgi:hypothetical protein
MVLLNEAPGVQAKKIAAFGLYTGGWCTDVRLWMWG